MGHIHKLLRGRMLCGGWVCRGGKLLLPMSIKLPAKADSRFWIGALMAVVLLMVPALFGCQLWLGYQTQINIAETDTRNLAALLETKLSDTLRRIDGDLKAIAGEIPATALNSKVLARYSANQKQLLDSHRIDFPEVLDYRIADAKGDTLYSSTSATLPRININDRSYFKQLRDDPKLGMVFSEVLMRRTSGQDEMVIARALRDGRGGFLGVAYAVLSLVEFQKVFQSLDLGTQGVAVLRRSDDLSLALRWPSLTDQANKPLTLNHPLISQALAGESMATAKFASQSDGIWRITSMRVLPNYPFVVMVGVSLEQTLAAWRAQAMQMGAAVFLIIALVMGLLIRFWLMREREYRMLGELSQFGDSQREMALELRVAAAAFESHDAMVITDCNGIIVRINQAFSEVFGYTAEEAVGQTPRILKSGRHDPEFYREMWLAICSKGSWHGEIWDRRKNGEEFPAWLTISGVNSATACITHYVGAYFDISERKQAEVKVNQLAFFDQLTGLPNRILLLDRLRQTIAAGSRSGSYSALLFIDLDDFKTLNDTRGHEMGEQLLAQVANRLTLCVRNGDTVARLGGDEFMLVLADLSTIEGDAVKGAEIVAEKTLASLNQRYLLGGDDYQGTASLGVTLFSGDVSSVDDLLKQADLALYKSKEAGRNTWRFFDPHMEIIVKQQAALETDLRKALAERQFLLHYQAQVVGNGQLTGVEALLRWQHPQRGMVAPGEFIPLAEKSGLILPLGHWVLETACNQLASWAERPEMAHLTIAVNVSANQFRQVQFVDTVLAILKNTRANPRRLKLELTESLLVSDIDEVVEKMFVLKAKGVGFSLDDFGTGYSSLTYLKRLPLDQLKIDQSFVRDVLIDPNDAAIAKTIVALAQSLGLGVIAEGVETERQRDFLANSGCHAYQGYLFSKPLPLEAFEDFAQRAEAREYGGR